VTRRAFLRRLPWVTLVPGLAREAPRAIPETVRFVPYRWPTDVGWLGWVEDSLGRAVGYVDWAGRIVRP
jgi:hypothetical protein